MTAGSVTWATSEPSPLPARVAPVERIIVVQTTDDRKGLIPRARDSLSTGSCHLDWRDC